jgi:VIT1/CCC1 family predicted Fe2+/Mn2+ transporter
MKYIVPSLYLSSMLFLMLLGAVSAKLGGSSKWKAILRITLWGSLAMALTALVGYLFGVKV